MSIQAIKSRMKSIESTRQITQSMYLVSSTKVQKARRYREQVLPYCESTENFMDEVKLGLYDPRSSLFKESKTDKVLIVLIGSDQGLCGGYNINVVKKAEELIASLDTDDYEIVTVGNALLDVYKRMDSSKLTEHFFGISETPFFEDAKLIAEYAFSQFISSNVGSVYVVYTEFHSMVKHVPVYKKLLPLEPNKDKAFTGYFNTEPYGEAFLAWYLPQWLSAALFRGLVDAAVSEESSRVSSMDAAVKNSDEMLEKLTLRYNRARQDIITQELIEIVNGSLGPY